MGKKLVLNHITYCGDGSIGLKLNKCYGVPGVPDGIHSVTIQPDQTVAEVMADVNLALAGEEGFEPLSSAEITHADAVRALAHQSPSVIERRDAWIAQKAEAVRMWQEQEAARIEAERLAEDRRLADEQQRIAEEEAASRARQEAFDGAVAAKVREVLDKDYAFNTASEE